MSAKVHHRDRCRLCSSEKLELVLELAPTPPADAYVPAAKLDEPQELIRLDLHICRDCGFTQLLDIVEAEDIYIDYIYETKSSLGLVEHFQGYAARVVETLRLKPDSFVMDLGSNDGALLRGFKNAGMRVLGVDPAREIAGRATESGIPTLAEFFTPELSARIRAEHGAADVITANNLYANVDDLDGFTSSLRSLLADDGVFIFESFYLVDYLENMVFDFAYHEHLSYFSIRPLVRFFAKHGMELIAADRVPTKGGSVRYTAQLAGGPRKAAPSVAELVALEKAAGVQDPATFRAFAKRIDEQKKRLSEFLVEAKAEGKKIAGYGASATTTTFLYHFGIDGETLAFIADDYPAKQGLYSPGMHIPVVPGDALYTEKPDYVIAIAWRYFRPIIEKHRKFLEGGGRFIVPLPDMRVVSAESEVANG